MRFRGVAIYRFNKDLPEELVSSLPEFIDDVNETVLVKGATSEEASKIVSYEVQDDALRFGMESGRQVKIHNAVLRLRNHMERSWGAMYRLGVREVSLDDLTVEFDKEYRVSLKLPYIKGIEVENGRTVVHLVRLSERELKRPILDRLLKLFEDKEARTMWGGKIEHWMLLERSRGKRPLYTGDPNKVLEEAGLIKRFSRGQWLYTPMFVALLKSLSDLFVEEIVEPLGFREAMFPKLYPLEVGLKTGHLKGTVNSMLFASFPRSYDIDEFEDVIDLMWVLDTVPVEDLMRKLEPPSSFLCFAQCEPFYQFFSGEIVDDDALPVKWYDRSGPSYRWEAGGLYGIERLVEFHRVEVVWMGGSEQVVEMRNRLLEGYRRFMEEILDIEWRWAWVTPFYLEQAGEVQEKLEPDLDRPGTIDFEVWLPYKGDREDKRAWLEVGNISIHGTKFTKPFRVKHSRGETIWTACSGFGAERWLLAFLSQKGLDPAGWPEKLIARLREHKVPKPLIAVTYPERAEGRKALSWIVEKLTESGLLER